MSEISSFIGKKVKIVSEDQWYEGIVKNIDIKAKKLVLKQVKDCQTGKIMKREQHFFGDQIKDLEIVTDEHAENEQEPSKPAIIKKEKIQNENMRTFPSVRKMRMDESDTGTSLFQTEKMDPSLYLSGYDYSTPNTNGLYEPPQAVLVDQLGKGFTNAITDINSQKVVSFSAEGHKIGRSGEINMIVIGTRHMVYLFDVLSIGDACFTNGISQLLQNENTLKVVHDVRLLSDCLYHVHNVKPKNVFDTQVADAFIFKQKSGSFPKEVSSLSQCVQMYLNVDPNECSFENEKRKMISKNKNIWSHRPLDINFQKLCAKTGMYLRELRPIMLQRLLAEFLSGVDIYLDSVRDTPNNTAKLFNARKLPYEFNKLTSKRKMDSWERQRVRIAEETDYNMDDGGSKSRNEWDTGRQFTDKYKEKHGEVVECMNLKEPMFDINKPLLRNQKERDLKKTESNLFLTHSSNGVDTSKKEKLQSVYDEMATTTQQLARSSFYNEKYQMSTSDSDDSSFFVSSVTDKHPLNSHTSSFNRKQLKLPKATHNKTSNFYSDSDWSTTSESMQEFTGTADTKNRDQQNSSLPSDKANSFSYEETRQRQSISPFKGDSPKIVGRGKILQMLSEQAQMKQPGQTRVNKFTNQRVLGNRAEFDFPSDDELLAVPRVAKMVNDGPLVGKPVNILEKPISYS